LSNAESIMQKKDRRNRNQRGSAEQKYGRKFVLNGSYIKRPKRYTPRTQAKKEGSGGRRQVLKAVGMKKRLAVADAVGASEPNERPSK